MDSWEETQLSITLPRKGRVEIGRKLLRFSGSRDCFFRRGETCPTLRLSGKRPCEREELIRVVQMGRRSLASGLLIEPGMASRRWLEGLTLEIVDRRSDSEIGEKEDQECRALQGRFTSVTNVVSLVGWQRFKFLTLLSKKSTNLLQRATEDFGAEDEVGLVVREITWKRRFGLFFAAFTRDLKWEDLALKMWVL